MATKNKTNDQVNIAELIEIIYKGKWKIVLILLISIISINGYQLTKKNNFKAITNIKPIGVIERNKYIDYNNLVKMTNKAIKDLQSFDDDEKTTNLTLDETSFLLKITEERLLNLYFESLNEKKIFEDAIRKFNLIEKSEYEDDSSYDEAIIKTASNIKLFLPNNESTNITGIVTKNLEKNYHQIVFSFNDFKKWKNILEYVDERTSQFVKDVILEDHRKRLSILKQLKKRKIEILKKDREYILEDLSTKINNLIVDYDRSTNDRLQFLKEQSSLAEILGIAKNTLEVQNFGDQNTVLSSIQTDSKPYYLRGYESINGEIKLIESRTDKKPFVSGLFKLEQTKRDIEQNKDIERFEKVNTIEEIELALKSTPISDESDFISASLDVESTKVISYNHQRLLFLSVVIGLIIGIIYTFIDNSFQSHRIKEKKRIK